MFKKKTVFVVGAGGSFEVGLPVGDELAWRISKKLIRRQGVGGDEIFEQALPKLALANNEQDLTHWQGAANEIGKSMPLALSIDNYLHTHSNNWRKVAVGKLAIARCILEAESESHLMPGEGLPLDFNFVHERYRSPQSTPSWHNSFFKMLTENVKADQLDDVFENVAFITFNYDRCIEHYLQQAFSQFMSLSTPHSRALCAKLEIIHPYGRVGDLTPGAGTYTAFGATLRHEQLVAASQQIRTFTERVTEQDTIERMQFLLGEAANVVFLGFSYGDMNLDLLQAKPSRDYKTIIGTAYGISPPNLKHIEMRLRQVLNNGRVKISPLLLENATCHSVINNYSRTLLS